MKVKILKRHPSAVIPHYATDGAGCFDICSVVNVVLRPQCREIIYTGLSFEIPEGHVLLVYSRSGHAAHGISLANSVGVIDSDYRGELKVMLHNRSTLGFYEVNPGDRVAQGMIIPIPKIEFELVDTLSETERGMGGFGSTGK